MADKKKDQKKTDRLPEVVETEGIKSPKNNINLSLGGVEININFNEFIKNIVD